jgi:hypothetical protein
VLAILLQCAGNLLTREELRNQLWPADTFVDFDYSLHNAVGRIREVLGDSAQIPRYIETLPRRGYRFIGCVEEVRRAQAFWLLLYPRSRTGPCSDTGPLLEKASQAGREPPDESSCAADREKEVAAAKELLLRQDVRLVTVTGPGGIGKTRLAVQVASDLVEHFPGGTHFVPLSSLSDPGLIPCAIIQALRIREAGAKRRSKY